MAVKKQSMIYLDVTKPNLEDNYYLVNAKNKMIGEVKAEDYKAHPEDFLTDEITTMRYTGYRKKKSTKPKTKRCKCK